MLACVCVWEVLGRGGSQAEEDLVHTRVEKKYVKRPEKGCAGPTAQECCRSGDCWPSDNLGNMVWSHTAFSQEAMAAPGCSAAGYSLCLLFHPALGVCRRWVAVQALQAPCSRGRKGAPAFFLQRCQSLPALG